MTAPLTVTEIDARTRDELQPPCECWTRQGPWDANRLPCDQPADWHVTYACQSCGIGSTELICDSHYQRMSAAEPFSWVVCGRCGVAIGGFDTAVRL